MNSIIMVPVFSIKPCKAFLPPVSSQLAFPDSLRFCSPPQDLLPGSSQQLAQAYFLSVWCPFPPVI